MRMLPEWALLPLRMAGLSANEIEEAVTEQARAERQAGIDEVDREIEHVDGEIDRIESQLLAAPDFGLEGVSALLHLALDRLRDRTVTDEGSVYFDFGDARVLSLLERAQDELNGALAEGQRRAS